MSKRTLIITALACEAAPLIEAWQAKPLRENPCAERFQVFHNDGVYIATSGIGKVKSAIATSALLTSLFPQAYSGDESPLVVNIGIAGHSTTALPIGTLTYINKVVDVASKARFYPDVLIRHGLIESTLETHDHPVTTPPDYPVSVDMEGSGMIQAALAITAPSSVCILKVISDHCSGDKLNQEQVSSLVAQNTEKIISIISLIRDDLPDFQRLSSSDQDLISTVCNHLRFTLTQRTEVQRRVQALHAQGADWKAVVNPLLQIQPGVKENRNQNYYQLLNQLAKGTRL